MDQSGRWAQPLAALPYAFARRQKRQDRARSGRDSWAGAQRQRLFPHRGCVGFPGGQPRRYDHPRSRFTSNDGRACRDALAPEEINWRCSADSWRSGAAAVNNEGLTSYDFTDAILRKLARKDIFPNLRSIVVAGHSAGGQYVSRYAMSNQVHDTLNVPVT